jgi:hypothetical protein
MGWGRAGARGEGSGRVKLAPVTRDARAFGERRPSRSRPWLAVTVPETAGDVGGVAGSPRVCQRVRHGSAGIGAGVAGSARERHGRRTESDEGVPGPSRKSHGVTKSVRTPRFRPCCPTVTDALHELTVPGHGQLMQRDFGPSSRARKGLLGAGRCDVPGIFVNDPGEVWPLSYRTPTYVRPRLPPRGPGDVT